MKSSNQNLKAKLEKNTNKLGRLFGFDGKVSPYFWEISEKGELTAKKILLNNEVWDLKSLEQISIEHFLNWLENRKKLYSQHDSKYYQLIDIFQSHLSDLQIYRAYYVDKVFTIFTGKTKDNNYFALCEPFPELNQLGRYPNAYKDTSDKFLIPDVSNDEAFISIVQDLELHKFKVIKGFSGNDDVYMWEMAETEDLAIEKVLASAKFLITHDFDGFVNLGNSVNMELTEFNELGEEFQDDYKELELFLLQELTNQRVYIIGTPLHNKFDMYVLGNDSDNDWVGILINVEFIA